MDSAAGLTPCRVRGCPIRRSPDHSVVATPRRFSQLPTSFFGTRRQGIHRMPFFLLLLVLPRHHPASLLGQSLTASSDAVSILFTAGTIAPSCHLRTRRDVSSLVNVHTPPRYSAVLVLPPTSRFSVFASPPRWGSTKSLPSLRQCLPNHPATVELTVLRTIWMLRPVDRIYTRRIH